MTDLPIAELRHLCFHLELKAEACRFLMAVGLKPPLEAWKKRSKLIERAKEIGVDLWMLRQFDQSDSSLILLEESFNTTASSVSFLIEAAESDFSDGISFDKCVALAAEAQSDLHSIIRSINVRMDRDQSELYKILLEIQGRTGRFIHSLGISSRLPTSDNVSSLQGRINLAFARIGDERLINDRFSELEQQIAAKPTSAGQWSVVAATVDRLVANGVRTSDVRIRNLLLPNYETIPTSETYPESFNLVLREIDSFLASRPELDEKMDREELTAEVATVRRFLEGRKVVLIGGLERPGSKKKLREAFKLKEMIWISTKPHESSDHFKPTVLQPGVAIVQLAIRFASHAFKDVKHTCDAANIPFVRLPAGYGCNQVAHQIVQQCGNRMRRFGNAV